MSSESIPVGLQLLLSKHYFLAQITRGKKPCMSNMTLVDASSWMGSFYRRWHGESRKTLMSDIEKIIDETIDYINTHSGQKDFLVLIINAMSGTRVGIESMTTTYRDDPEMLGRIQVQLTNIDLQLNKHQYLIKGYNKIEKTEEENAVLDTIVNSTNVEDKEGLREFLTGRSRTKPVGTKPVETRPLPDVVIDESSERRRRRRVRDADNAVHL